MKNNIFNLIEYLYYFSLASLFILYLYPGSIIGYFMYEDVSRQPNIIKNPAGTTINHFLYFLYLTILAAICNYKNAKILNNINFIFFISIVLELSHFFIPKRAFETYDLIANVSGVLVIFTIKRFIK